MSEIIQEPKLKDLLLPKLVNILTESIYIPATSTHTRIAGDWTNHFCGHCERQTWAEIWSGYGAQRWNFQLPNPSRIVEVEIEYLDGRPYGGTTFFKMNGEEVTKFWNVSGDGDIVRHSVFLQYYGKPIQNIEIFFDTDWGNFLFYGWILKYRKKDQ